MTCSDNSAKPLHARELKMRPITLKNSFTAGAASGRSCAAAAAAPGAVVEALQSGTLFSQITTVWIVMISLIAQSIEGPARDCKCQSQRNATYGPFSCLSASTMH